MGREQPLIGDSGENLVLDLLRRSFLSSSKAQSGAPIDWVCSELRAAPKSPCLYRDPALQFHFQVKTTEKRASIAEIARSTFRNWLACFEYQPVTLIFVKPRGVGKQSFLYLTLHDWLLSPPGPAALASRGTASVRIGGPFAEVSADGLNFHNKMIEEADRATAALSSPWATLRAYGLHPFDEATLLEYTELAQFAEIPIEITRRLATIGTSARHLVREFMQSGTTEDAVLQNWLDELRRLAPQPSATSFQRRQFKKFVHALKHFREEVNFPQFRVAEVNLWRSFVAMYPHSRHMLDHVVRHSENENHLMFASALLPMLALSQNPSVSGDAWDTIRKLARRRNEFQSYAFQRELYRGPAEAGDLQTLNAGIDFITRRPVAASERRFLARYGWVEELLSANLNRKLNHPTYRDQQLYKWYEAMADILLVDTEAS